MTSQQYGNAVVGLWWLQDARGIPPEKRTLPENDNRSPADLDLEIEAITRELDPLRACIDRR